MSKIDPSKEAGNPFHFSGGKLRIQTELPPIEKPPTELKARILYELKNLGFAVAMFAVVPVLLMAAMILLLIVFPPAPLEF